MPLMGGALVAKHGSAGRELTATRRGLVLKGDSPLVPLRFRHLGSASARVANVAASPSRACRQGSSGGGRNRRLRLHSHRHSETLGRHSDFEFSAVP